MRIFLRIIFVLSFILVLGECVKYSFLVQSLRKQITELNNNVQQLGQQLEIPDEELNESLAVLSALGADGPRDGHWATLAKHRAIEYPDCEWKGCDTPRYQCNQHHCISVHWAKLIGHPWLELYKDNIITLCHNHHLKYGHCGNYRRFNLDIKNDAKEGKFNSRSLSTWPGEDEMKSILKNGLGAPSKSKPNTTPLFILDPKLSQEETSVCINRKTLLAI